MKIKSFLTASLLILFSSHFFSQKWVEGMQRPDGNLYQIQADFESYWSTRDKNEKGKGYKTFRRWEDFAAPRVYPTGDLSLLNQTGPNFQEFIRAQQKPGGTGKPLGNGGSLIASSTWTAMGPFGPITSFTKNGRLNFLTIDPTNTLNLWVGAPAGGLWKSTNGGLTWSTNTDQLSVIGCSDLAIDPTNTNIMYLATGDGDAGDTRSIGVLKSTDGGATWNPTGLVNTVASYFLIRRLIINPANPQILLAATNSGVFRTTNGGTTWVTTSSANTFDLEFKPGDPNTVYAGGNSLRISTNGGVSFSIINNGIPSSGFERSALAVTPADPNYVYVLASDPTNSGFYGLYRSVNSGTLFALMSNTTAVNVLGFSANGGDVGGNGWYDLCIAASPLNPDEIVTGGVNVWKSSDGGVSWGINGHWTGSFAPFVHADHHDLEYAPDGTLYSCNDGTIYKRTVSQWQELSGQINISQMYKMNLSAITPNRWITGHQDNGTNLFNGSTYSSAFGGDGMDCFIDRTNDLNMFGETQNGGLRRSMNGGSWSQCVFGLTGNFPWVTVWKQDPITPNILYCGVQNMFVSTDYAGSWTQLTTLPVSGGNVNEFAIAPSNNQVLYVLKNSGIYKTTNGGNTWTAVTNGVPVNSSAPTFITIHPTDPNTAWVTLSGYSAGLKVYKTTNGGTTWTNYSGNLPNLPANCSVYDGATGILYVGMDVGIYYRHLNASVWTLYNLGLPNVPVRDLEISPATPTLVHAATYGRGVYVASAYAATTPPSSQFTSPVNGLCVAAALTFTDISDNIPSAWSWSVSPSTGVVINSPSAQNPTITFAAPGSYTVFLQATNSIGPGSIYSQVINIVNPPSLVISALTGTSVCRNSPVTFSASGAATYTWSNSGGSAASATFFPLSAAVYTVSGTNNNCTAFKTVTAIGLPLPVVSIVGPTLICSGDQVTLTGTGANTYSWSNSFAGSTNTVSPTSDTNYSVTGTDANGCSGDSYHTLKVSICEGITKNGAVQKTIFSVFPNPAKLKVSVSTNEPVTGIAEAAIFDVGGKLIKQDHLIFNSGQQVAEINISQLVPGIYFLKITSEKGPDEVTRIIKE